MPDLGNPTPHHLFFCLPSISHPLFFSDSYWVSAVLCPQLFLYWICLSWTNSNTNQLPASFLLQLSLTNTLHSPPPSPEKKDSDEESGVSDALVSYLFMPRGDSQIILTGVIVGNFEWNPLEVQSTCFVGVVCIKFYCKRYQFFLKSFSCPGVYQGDFWIIHVSVFSQFTGRSQCHVNNTVMA